MLYPSLSLYAPPVRYICPAAHCLAELRHVGVDDRGEGSEALIVAQQARKDMKT